MSTHSVLAFPIRALPRTHSSTINRLAALGMHTWGDLLTFFPRRYVDYSLVSPIGSAQPGEVVTIKGTIKSAKNRFVRRSMSIQEIVISDGTGEITLTWFNQPYLVKNSEKPDITFAAAGLVEQKGQKRTMKPQEYEILTTAIDSKHTGKVIPIYPEKLHLSSRTIRDKVALVLEKVSDDELVEWLPPTIVQSHHLMPYATALRRTHMPSTIQEAEIARKRFAFEELFLMHLARALVKQTWIQKQVPYVFVRSKTIDQKLSTFQKALPFTLTPSQQVAWNDIQSDLMQSTPMNRFLQGDVGSGKTVVAALASYFALTNKRNVLFMAPTSILAQQHFATLQTLFAGTDVTVELVTADSTKRKPKKTDQAPARSSSRKLIVGTHALLTATRTFGSVGLVIIDEQHRFGVAQRALLKNKATVPHLLTMTATPIPRTIALTLFGDLNISVLSDMPPGRLPIKTYVAPSAKRQGAYAWMRTHITKHGNQVFVICPRIEADDEDTNTENALSLKNVTEEWENLQNKIFPDLKVAMLHGKMKPKEKDLIMEKFKNKEFHILVSTTVVEVGIDIPNATIILIEGAERYGLAQLHQLRGRVGRSSLQSYCILFPSDRTAASERLHFFARTTSGIALAEYDFKHRGPGDLFGTAQHGSDELKIASLFDFALVSEAQKAAVQFFPSYSPSTHAQIATRLQRFSVDTIAKD